MSLDLTPIIAEHGHAVLSVQTDHPAESPWSYTVGRADQGRPELIVFGLDPDAATALLNELARLDDAGPRLRPDVPVHPWPEGTHVPVGLGSVHPEHVDRYLAAATTVPSLRALQVGLPDNHGALPRQGLLDCDCCPDLTRAGRPWSRPYDPRSVPLPSARRVEGPVVDVCLPVIGPDGSSDRTEVVPCRPLGDRAVEVLEPPVLADWTTAGAVLELAPDHDDSGLPFAAVEVRRSPLVHLTWWLHCREITERDAAEQLCATLDRVAAVADGAVTWADDWLAVAALPSRAERVRSQMRHLMRDGLVTESTPYSEDGGPCTDPHCGGSSAP